SYVLAGVLYFSRALVVEVLLPPARRESQCAAETGFFHHRRNALLAARSNSPVGIMLSLLGDSKVVVLATCHIASVSWSQGQRTFFL
ncbi:hypothetical protein K432DRAFT_275408, partial [Lepidopterella palustris CBS 459.81]